MTQTAETPPATQTPPRPLLGIIVEHVVPRASGDARGDPVIDLFQSLMILALCVAVYRLEGLRRKDKEERR